ncbi:hypothetical protein D3C81_2044150 [compost metagenome]
MPYLPPDVLAGSNSRQLSLEYAILSAAAHKLLEGGFLLAEQDPPQFRQRDPL